MSGTKTATTSHESAQETPPDTARDPVEAVPAWWRLGLYGLQHVLAFYAGAVLMPLLVADGLGLSASATTYLVNASLISCGIATILQTVGIRRVGIRLPIVQGTSTTAVPSLVTVGVAAGGGEASLPTIFGAVIFAGLTLFVIAPYFGRMIRFFPPVVTGTVVLVVGITLLAIAAKQVGGGDPKADDFGSLGHLGIAGVTLLVILLLHKFARGFLATIAILVGLLVGTVVASLFGRVHFSSLGSQAWVGFSVPLHFGAPRIAVAAVLSLVLVMFIVAVESIGQFVALGEVVGRRVEGPEVTAALRADGLATAVAGLCNSFPTTVYSQNIGLVQLTRIRSRWIVATSGVIMLVLGAMPKVGAVVSAMPASVLGGATLVLFSTIAVVGVQILLQADLTDQRNLILVATSLGVGFLPTAFPQFAEQMPTAQLRVLFENGIVLGTLSAVLLNVFFHHMWPRGPASPSGPEVAEESEGWES